MIHLWMLLKKIELQQRYKKVRFFTCPNTFSMSTGFGFPLPDDDKKDDEEDGKRKRRRTREWKRRS